MALINHRTHEIHFKIVYYGPGLCGKTTNLKSLHDRLPPERRGKMISIATDQERTLFFDFLPIDLGQVNGFLTRFHLYTVPGQVYYRLSRRAVLQGVDGLVFVADSHPAREAANRDSLIDLNDHLRTLGITGPALARIPWVFQWNKRDSAVALPLERLRRSLNPNGWPEFEATASEGKGVSETLRAACKAVLARLGTGTAAATPSGAPVAAAATAPAAPSAIAVPAPVPARATPVPVGAAARAPATPVAVGAVAGAAATPATVTRPAPASTAPDAGWSPHMSPAPQGAAKRIVAVPGSPPSIVVPAASPASATPRSAAHGVTTVVERTSEPDPDEPARP